MKNPMRMLLALLAVFSFLSPQLAWAAKFPAAEEAQIVQVFLVRHGEKDTRGHQDPSLSIAGRRRAGQLAHVLRAAGVTHLFSSGYARTMETLGPLALAQGLTVVQYNVRDPKDVLGKLHALPAGSVAVVAGHSNTTPQLFQALGAKQPQGLDARGFLSEKAYDRLYSVTLRVGSGEPQLVASLEQRYGAGESVATDLRVGNYLGESPPEDSIEMFARDFLCTGLSERDLALSPDGTLLLSSLTHRRESALVLVERKDQVWGIPRIAPFSGTYPDLEPAFDPRDGSLWFVSKRPLPGETEAGDWNIWRITRSDKGWAEPAPVKGLNGPGDEFYPSISKDGLVVFTATREGGEGGEDLWFATETKDGWQVTSAGPNINTTGAEFNSCLSPDGTQLLFGSQREGDQGGGDLYLSERDPQKGWQPARPLTRLNSPALDYCPSFTPDGKHLWFTSRRKTNPTQPETLTQRRERLLSPGNGQDDIYWVPVSWLKM